MANTTIEEEGSQQGASRRSMTFAQAEGVEPLPAQLKPKEVSQELRSILWAFLSESINGDIIDVAGMWSDLRIGGKWRNILIGWHVVGCHRFVDEFDDKSDAVLAETKRIIAKENYVGVFGFLEFVIRNEDCPPGLSETINWALRKSRAAYRIVDESIIPIATDAEAETLTRALVTLRDEGFTGGRSHLAAAIRHVSSGEWSSAVRESIHAVESVAKVLEPGADTLGPALTKLARLGHVHPGLQKAFSALYGYASNEKGVRHALVFSSEADVDEADALFMVGACASFVTYMVARTASSTAADK